MHTIYFSCFIPFVLSLSFKVGLFYHRWNEPGVMTVINKSKSCIEPYSDLVSEAFFRLTVEFTPNTDSYAQQENDSVEEKLSDSEGENEDLVEIDFSTSKNASSQNYIFGASYLSIFLFFIFLFKIISYKHSIHKGTEVQRYKGTEGGGRKFTVQLNTIST